MTAATPPVLTHVQLDAQGQNDRLSRLYTQLCFCFPLNKTSSPSLSRIHKYLEDGLERLTMSFPWVAGHVVKENSLFSIRPFRATPMLSMVDFRSQMPPFEEYQAKGFPFYMLDEDVVAPRKTLPERFDEPAPVLLLQATIVDGGMTLVANGQHNCMDMRGQSQIIRLLAKACRNETYTREDLRLGNLPRADIIPPLESEDLSPAKSTLPHDAVSVVPVMSSRDSDANSRCTWAYFLFSLSALTELKKLAEESMSADYVSTDDVLSALVWQSVTRARLARYAFRIATSTFDRQVDARKYLGIPTSYTGNVVCKVSSRLAVHQVLEMSLGVLASHLRMGLQSTDIGYTVRRAVIIAQQENCASQPQSPERTASTSRGVLPPTDIRMSSWAKEDCYDLDFGGVLGKPEAVRRPSFPAWEGLVYLLPKRLDGEIAVALCLREEDMGKLKHDEAFMEFCSYIG